MQLHMCQDLGEITVVAVRQKPSEPRQKFIKGQRLPNSDIMHTFKNIGGIITGINKVERYYGKQDADIVITFDEGVDAKQATQILDHLLGRVTKFLDKRIRQQTAYENLEPGFALTSEIGLNDFFNR